WTAAAEAVSVADERAGAVRVGARRRRSRSADADPGARNVSRPRARPRAGARAGPLPACGEDAHSGRLDEGELHRRRVVPAEPRALRDRRRSAGDRARAPGPGVARRRRYVRLFVPHVPAASVAAASSSAVASTHATFMTSGMTTASTLHPPHTWLVALHIGAMIQSTNSRAARIVPADEISHRTPMG